MRHSKRFHLALSDPLDEQLRSYAGRHGLSLAEALRTLALRSLSESPVAPDIRDSPASLAALVAAEHAALMVAAVLPDGRRRMAELAPEAAAAAEQRLAMFEEAER